ncbi:hypothetical protein EV643_114231 [Kribbella sp. VKM Ac-2527]|uniref:Uncharacterized protein n=1 Tax=Kribbella caucasensis TaxID=2512215 RepID=A0A4R6K6M2_9ACTN|nr:hypothetical protein [Kribbella sp. VKM Ac-2527]TDO45086.1 hypothetical protein EV643_114231 [Kribbella sp. VKM Ac-2527]
MSTPNAGPERNPIRRLTTAVSNWHHTRRGRSMVKGAYARAYSDARRMDKDFLERIGRADLTPGDLQVLSTAHLEAEYGNSRQVAYAQALDSIVAGRVQAAAPSAQTTRNPIKMVANRYSRWSNVRQGRATLRAGYALAEQSLKRMDPAALQRISREGVTRAALQNRIETRMDQVIRPELHQNAAAPGQVQGQAPAQTPGQAAGQAPAQAPAQSPAQAQGQAVPAPAHGQAVPAQAQGQAAPVPGQAQAGPGAAPQAGPPTIAQRIGQAAGTVSRWAQTAWSATTNAARQAAQAFTAARQNPEADPRTTEAWNSPGYTGRDNQVASRQVSPAAYEPTGIHPIVRDQSTAGPERTAAEPEQTAGEPAANHDVGKHPIVSEQATGEPVASQAAEDQKVVNQPVEVGDALAPGASSGADVKAQTPAEAQAAQAARAAQNGVPPLRKVSPEAVGAAVTQAQAGTGHSQQQQTTQETGPRAGRG